MTRCDTETKEKKISYYTVIAGCLDKETKALEFVQSLGYFFEYEKAYGEAYLHLNDLIQTGDSDERSKKSISPLFDLEWQTGCGMKILGSNENIVEFAYILFNEMDNKSIHDYCTED